MYRFYTNYNLMTPENKLKAKNKLLIYENKTNCYKLTNHVLNYSNLTQVC